MRKKLIARAWMLSLLLAWAIMPVLMLEKQAMAADAVTLEVLVPAGAAEIPQVELAKRVDTLDGKRIALHWNGKPGGEWLLAEVEARLRAQFKDFEIYRWPDGTAWKADVQRFIKDQPVDVAILAVGD